MKYPSELLHDIADRLDPIEDELLERYYGQYLEAKQWISGWRVWEWRNQQEKLQTLRERHEGLRNDYYELCELYTEQTGKQPPLSTYAALSSFESALKQLGERMRENLRRMAMK
jgi:uncharacterized protein YukJ